MLLAIRRISRRRFQLIKGTKYHSHLRLDYNGINIENSG